MPSKNRFNGIINRFEVQIVGLRISGSCRNDSKGLTLLEIEQHATRYDLAQCPVTSNGNDGFVLSNDQGRGKRHQVTAVRRLGQRYFNPFLFQTSLNSVTDGCTFAFSCVRVHQEMGFGRLVALMRRMCEDRSKLRAMNAFFLPNGHVRIKIERWSKPFVLLDHKPLTPFQRLKPSLDRFHPLYGK